MTPATIPAMNAPFQEIYTDEQRDALATAYVDRGIRPARRVVELAEAGALADGLAAFVVAGKEGTVRDLARKLRLRRAGKLASEASQLPPRDAIEALRRRLVSAIEHELTAIERHQKKTGKGAGPVDPERLRQLARAVREAALIPEPGKVAPAAAHPKEAGKRSGVTRGGLAGAIMRDAESTSGETATPPLIEHATSGGMAPSADLERAITEEATDGGMGEEEGLPGDWTRDQIQAQMTHGPDLIPTAGEHTYHHE